MAAFAKEDILRLAGVVREVTGNSIDEKNFSMLESRMQGHLMKLGLQSMQEYWEYFSAHERTERETLQGLMTTHYTYFFRESAHFEALQSWINTESQRLKDRFKLSQRPVRVWSAACSRGQEVYSLASFLEVHLFQKWGVPFEVIGTDIDPDSVSYAKNGVYPLKEVNTIPRAYLQGFWRKGTGTIKDFAAVHPKVKSRVRFATLNLLEVKSWAERESFDVIFCRNVFIYFTPDKVKNIALSMIQRLDARGLFVSGMSEPMRFDGWELQSVGPSCYQRRLKEPPEAPVARSSGGKPAAEKKYRVLCVDDSTTIQMLMRKIFSQDLLCEKVDVAGNGREARLKLDAGSYDLITLDIHMPEVSGLDFLEKLYKKESDPPVLMVSSVNRVDMDLASKALNLGAFDYVEKPALNNLQQSAEEILTKAKMAIKGGPSQKTGDLGSFEASIGRSMTAVEPTNCLRVIFASELTKTSLQQIIKEQESDSLLPATLIVADGEDFLRHLETNLRSWSRRPVSFVLSPKHVMKPGQYGVVKSTLAPELFRSLKQNTLSLQILDERSFLQCGYRWAGSGSLQLLVEESLAGKVDSLETASALKVSDITPATSFFSLSREFFAKIRGAAA